MRAFLRRGLAILLLLLLLASACGGGEEATPDNQGALIDATHTPVPYVQPGTTLVPPLEQSALATIRERGEMRVGVLYNHPPFTYLTEQGELAGFEADLVRAIAEKWGVEVSFVQVTHQTGLTYLLDSQVDLLAAVVAHRREMHQLADFSQTTFRSGYLMLVPEDSPIEGFDDLDGAAVGIVEDASFDVVGAAARNLGVAPTAQRYGTTDEAVAALLNGQVRAVVDRREALMQATQEHPGLSIREEFLQLEPYAFVLRRGDANFRNLLDVTLQELVDDGTYAALFNQHFYGYAADQPLVWPGESAPTFASQPTSLDLPSESRVASVASGEAIAVAGWQSSYDDPPLDNQRLVDDFNRALVNEIARRWGVSVEEVESGGGEAGVASVSSGQADLAVGVLPRRELSEGADYSQGYLRRGLRLARLSDTVIEGADDLESRPVAVLGPVETAAAITSESAGVDVESTSTPRQLLLKLQDGSVDAVIADEFTLGLMAREDPNVVVMPEMFAPTYYVVAVPRFDGDFLALVNFTLQDMHADGTLERLVEQYFGPYAPAEDTAEPPVMEVWPGSGAYLGLNPDA